MQNFDPYHRWLGIPPHEQPPTLYRLLGISDFESDQDVITEASYRQIGHVKQYASGPHRDAANQILNELSQAQVTLQDLKKKTQYDISIQATDNEIDDSVADDEATVDLDVPMVVGAGSVRGGSFKEGLGSKQPKNLRRKKRSNIPTILFLVGMLAFIGVTFAYWWNQQNNGQPEGTIANNTEVNNPEDTAGPSESQSDDPANPVEPVKPIENKTAEKRGTDTSVSPRATGSKASQSDRSSQSEKVPPTAEGVPTHEAVPAIASGAKPDDLTVLNDVGRTTERALYASGVKTLSLIHI